MENKEVLLCEKCKTNYFEKNIHNRKYCDDCKSKYRLPKKIGIYKITNKINGKCYIGQSLSILERFNNHKYYLKKNLHQNQYLQNSFNKYGISNFEFEILEECDKEDLYIKEFYWIELYNSHIRTFGYNIDKPSVSDKKYNMSEETKQKSSETKTVYSKEDLISYLQEYYYHFGKVPTTQELINMNGFPSNLVFFKRFGSYKNALIEADLYDFYVNKEEFDKPVRTKEEILEMFRLFVDKNGRFPSSQEIRKSRENNLPSQKATSRYFPIMQDLKNLLGETKNMILLKENEEAIELLKQYYSANGSISSRDLGKKNGTRSSKFYQNRFGSLENAYKLANIPYQKHFVKYDQFILYLHCYKK